MAAASALREEEEAEEEEVEEEASSSPPPRPLNQPIFLPLFFSLSFPTKEQRGRAAVDVLLGKNARSACS